MEVNNEDNLRLDGCQNEFDDYKNSTRRPWSADNPPRFQYSAYETIYTDGSVDSAEELEGMLPSSALLDELLSETLYSWRNGKRTKQSRKGKHARRCPPKLTKRAVQPYENDTPSADSDTNSSAESVTKPEVVEKSALMPPSPVNEYQESIKAMTLLPGLKTKPPIPKKPQTSPGSRKSFHDRQNFELITDNMLSYLPVDHSQSSSSTLDEVKWLDEIKNHDEVQASEINTDLSIQHLKQSQATQCKGSDSESDVSHTTQLNDISNFEQKVSGAKRVNFENVDFSMYEKRKMKPCPKNFIKENIKLTSRRSRKKPSNSDSDESLNCAPKFAPTPIRSSVCSRKPPTDVESWMGRDEYAKPIYSACLDRVDELQEVCKGTRLAEVDVSDADDGSTYDDIVEILQTLDEEDKRSHTKMEAMKKMVSEQLSCSEIQKHAKLNVDTDQRDEEQPSRSSISSSTNLNDIFHFLDEVDKNCSKSLSCAKERFATATQLLDGGLHLDTIPRLEELLEHSNLELSNYVIQLSLRLKEKSSSVALLQKELSSLREQVTKMSKEASETVRQKLRIQKEDYENAVKRHQKFIDQLITDKKTLNQQCEGLVQDMKVLEDKYNSNLKAAEHKHRVELQKLKEMQAAGEKMRRDRWIDSKTQKIKEMTVKGLEPEVDKMNARHQQELMDLRMLHKREIEDMELRSARKLQQHCEALRDQLVTEREKALAQEREVLRQRYEQMVEAEEQRFQEQRRRLLADHTTRVTECEDRENAATAEKERAVKQAQNEFEDKLQTMMRKHNIELNLLKEKTEMEMETFRNTYKKQVAIQLGEKEAQIREKCRKERDKEIDSVIERLELEASENKQQLEESLENRIRRLKEKYEKEIRDLEQSEREINGKYSENKLKLAEADEQILTLKASSKQLELQLLDLKQLTAKLSSEREHVKEIIKDEMKQEARGLEKELQEVKSDKERELQKVYARVKVAVARKDETISELSRDHIALQEKCAYLESMLEQQRKEYLMK